MTWNVNGIRACAKKGLLEYLEREDPDILCIQETKAHPEQLDESLLHPPGRSAYWSSALKRGYSGTVTYTKREPDSIQHGIRVRKFDSEGRFVVTQYPDFLLYNVYFPNGAASEERHDFKQEFLEKFRRHLAKRIAEGLEVIVVGDYNVAYRETDVFDPVRLSKVSGFLPEEREWFGRFLKRALSICSSIFIRKKRTNIHGGPIGRTRALLTGGGELIISVSLPDSCLVFRTLKFRINNWARITVQLKL